MFQNDEDLSNNQSDANHQDTNESLRTDTTNNGLGQNYQQKQNDSFEDSFTTFNNQVSHNDETHNDRIQYESEDEDFGTGWGRSLNDEDDEDLAFNHHQIGEGFSAPLESDDENDHSMISPEVLPSDGNANTDTSSHNFNPPQGRGSSFRMGGHDDDVNYHYFQPASPVQKPPPNPSSSPSRLIRFDSLNSLYSNTKKTESSPSSPRETLYTKQNQITNHQELENIMEKSKQPTTPKKRVRFSEKDILFPITYIPVTPRDDEPNPTASTVTITKNVVLDDLQSSKIVGKEETSSTLGDTNTTSIPSIQGGEEGGRSSVDSYFQHGVLNTSADTEDDEFKTNDGKRRLFGLTGYQYLVLSSAWLGWAFDIFDGVLFSYAAPICIPNLLGFPDDQITSTAAKEQTALWSSILSSVLLFGWGCGGVFFGWLTDKIGRSKTMMITIIVYSIGTCLAAFSFHISVLVILRFFASLGIGGEWSAGAALISETLPIEKRVIGGVLLYTAAPIGSMASFAVNYIITSVLLQKTNGTMTNGTFVNTTMIFPNFEGNSLMSEINAPVVTGGPIPLWLSWRILFAIGIVPTIVGIFVRIFVKEPDAWVERQKRQAEEEYMDEEDSAEVQADDQAPTNEKQMGSTSQDNSNISEDEELKEIDLKEEVMPTVPSTSDVSSTSITSLKKKKKRPSSSYLDLFQNNDLRKRTISAILFVCPALISWWSISTFIPILASYLATPIEDSEERKYYQDLYSVVGNMLFNFGGLLGTLLVIPVATRLGRLWVYRIYFFFSTVFIIIAFGIPQITPMVRMCLMFPVGLFVFGAFGSFTFYLPELFPMELRGRGAGFTYNCGRFGTAAFPFIVGLVVSQGVNPLIALSCISLSTFVGFIVSVIPRFGVETRGVVIH